MIRQSGPGSGARLVVIAGLVALLLAALTACGGDDSAEPGAASDAAYNKADVQFASEMIQHHAQALQMVDLTVGRALDPDVQALAEAILGAQGPEIETMTTWLTDWGQPIPPTSRDHVNAEGGHGDTEASELPGMLTAEEMTGLESASDAEFESLWLAAMIRHHQGAIEMADQQQAEGKFPEAVALAATIAAAQEAEIAEMERLFGR